MKKFTKACLILAALFAFLGAVLSIIGIVTGGTFRGNPFIHFDGLEEYVWRVKTESTGTGMEAATEVPDGEVSEYISRAGKMTELERISVGREQKQFFLTMEGGVVQLVQGETDEIRIFVNEEYEDLVHIWQSEGELEIQVKKIKFWKENSPVLCVEIPEDQEWKELDIEINAGVLEADGLLADEMTLDLNAGSAHISRLETAESELEVSAGRLVVDELQTDIADITCDAGELEVNGGEIYREGEISCNVGIVAISLDADPDAYTYDLESAVGSVSINGKKYAGIQEGIRRGEGSRKLSFSCNLGSIVFDAAVLSGNGNTF